MSSKRCRDTNAALLAVTRRPRPNWTRELEWCAAGTSNCSGGPSKNEHQQLPRLRLDFQAQRLRISPVLAINPAVLERNSIEANLKLVAQVAAAKKGHNKAQARNNEDNRKVKEATIAKAVQAAGGKVTKAVGRPTNAVGGLTEKDIRMSTQLFEKIMERNDVARDFLMCNKVSVLPPAKGGRLQPLQQEAEAKVVHNEE